MLSSWAYRAWMDHNQPPKSVIVLVVEGTTYVLDDAGYVPTDTRTFPVHDPDGPVRELRPVSEQVRKYENLPRSCSRISARSFSLSPSKLCGQVKHLANKAPGLGV
jgi:hypothetical protein